jgi:Domain of unknown function (DUF4189)
MQAGIKTFLVIGLMASWGFVYGEGGSCPDGYYPVGGRGTSGCAPFPGSTSNNAPSAPRIVWATRWGAIGGDSVKGILGTATGVQSKRQAQKIVVAQCRDKGGTNCKVDLVYKNQCAAMAVGKDGMYSTASAATIERATELSMQECNSASTDCRVYYSDCSLPERTQ